MLVFLGFCFFAVNRAQHVSAYVTGMIVCAIVASSLTALLLAFHSLGTLSMLYITRAVSVALIITTVFARPYGLVLTAMLLITAAHLPLFSERIISRCAFDIGSNNENTFILRTPQSITLWFLFTWSVVWGTFIEMIHLFVTHRSILGVLMLIIGGAITAIFLPSQLRILLRRCVIVPNGVVLSDPISLTDVVLFPLAKIATVEHIAHVDPNVRDNATTFAPVTSFRNGLQINLSDTTDSLIVRNTYNETQRRDTNCIVVSVAEPKAFVKVFHERFHHVEPQELSPAQQKMVEKQLGIETAPRSDAPLPQHRAKKKKS